jgi:DoxX-like family
LQLPRAWSRGVGLSADRTPGAAGAAVGVAPSGHACGRKAVARVLLKGDGAAADLVGPAGHGSCWTGGMRRLKVRHLHALYWITTLLFVVPQGWAAVQYLVEAPRMAHVIAQLGYPDYFMAILGVAKLLGIAAIVTGVSPTLKEWAFAGFTFEVCAAFVSHLSAGDPLSVALVPLAFLVVQLASYALWRRLRDSAGSRARRGAYRQRERALAESVA